MAELALERDHLKELGLTEDEIDGYIDFYWETWFPLQDNRRLD